ncbi:TetR/AcrR family transcriptional regulator [Methylomicrobium sp. Wu6]|uniref:TetR/AcrR family transcriptional regulator n=1 Tax=Methylomicrobium sp. Wu6 TaxID=3107928 RepID=UPI002DD68EE2|nr:TetR/AcrR family transcriptional regulator [Methylomicrobium sp. Wu6]MEC4748301.1 TetR/AcrR family transcriptional regulator [Methylomicrobium sp. Wu6]
MDQEKEDTQTKADAQDEILLAALKLFAEKGYFNTSLTDIADAAGVKGTSGIYHHFKNKQMIAAALYANIFDSLNVSIDDIRRKNQKPSEQLRGIVDLLFRLTDDAPNVMQLLLVLNINEILPDEKPLIETPPFVKILKIFQTGTKNGDLRNLPPQLCFAYFFGIINHTLRLVLTGALDKTANTYQPQTWLAAWNAIAKK